MLSLKMKNNGELVDPEDLIKYPVYLVVDTPFYGRVIYNHRIDINVESRIPVWRRVIALIHEGLHVINPGWTHIQLHNLAVSIFLRPEATAEELALMTKAYITERKLNAIRQYAKKHAARLL